MDSVEREFESLDAGGVTLGIVINLLGSVVVPPSANVDVLSVDYTIVGTADTTVDFCDTLGTPPVAAVVVVAGPTRHFPPHEIEALDAYVARGGGLFVAIDPRAQTNLYGLAAGWGVEFGDDEDI